MSIESVSSIVSIPDAKLTASVYSFEICEVNRQKFTVLVSLSYAFNFLIVLFYLKFRYLKS